mmetsp:Transcript_23076/g.26330  ORF Transcript_23076/g.26330 Transcript_23076/m.26330 type:complete len:97 (+) Transcript_23076:190-480(+)
MIRPPLMLLRPTFFRTTVAKTQSRRAGGFPPSMNAKKNKFCEEWNGRREITEHRFEVDQKKVPPIFMLCIVIPFGVYFWVRGEMISKDERQYREIC